MFGFDLSSYNELYEEKLELLVNIRDNEFVTHNGIHRSSINNLGVYPRTKDLVISVAVGGTPASVIRAAKYGLPLTLAIIGGNPLSFKGLIDLYKRKFIEYGHKKEDIFISVHSHGFIDDDYNQAFDDYYPSVEQAMNIIGKDRGWHKYNKRAYELGNELGGALLCRGDPAYVAKKLFI